MQQDIYLSILIPVFEEENNLEELTQRLKAVLTAWEDRFEIVFVDDGSRDRSNEVLKNLFENNNEIKVVELATNSGQHLAIAAGFAQTKGRYIITLDADLQNPPEEIPKIISFLEKGYPVVAGRRIHRKDPVARKLVSFAVNKIVAKTAGIRIHDFGCMLRGYKREVLEEIIKVGQKSLYIPALAAKLGYEVKEIKVEHHPRKGGESKYNFMKLLRLNFDLLTGISIIPIQMISLIGIGFSILGFLLGFYIFFRRILFGPEVEGVFTLFAISSIFFGILCVLIGIVGEYVGRIYGEIQKFPTYKIKQVYERKANTRPGILIFGYHEIGAQCLSYLIEKREEILGLVTHEDSKQENIYFKTPMEIAIKNCIPVFMPANPNNVKMIEIIRRMKPDIILSFMYRKILGSEILKIPPLGSFNLHPSLLPKYRGRCPVNWVLINGEQKTGVTLHKMTKEADAGDIISQVEIPIHDHDDASALMDKVIHEGVNLFKTHWDSIKHGSFKATPQDHSVATKFGKRRPEDGLIDWTKSSIEIRNLIRGVANPFPGAYTFLDRVKVIFMKADIVSKSLVLDHSKSQPGQIVGAFEENGILVLTGNGLIDGKVLLLPDNQEIKGKELFEFAIRMKDRKFNSSS